METVSEQVKKNKSNHSIIEVLDYCQKQNLPARVVGKWVWIEFESKPDAEVRQGLKDMGFRWSRRRKQWAHNCGHSSRPARNYRPWDKYQTVSIDEAYVNAGMGVAV